MTTEHNEIAPFAIREMAKADEAFIFNSWLKSYRDSPTVRSVPNTIYFQAHHAIIEKIFADPGVRVLIACNPADSEQIYGYAVGTVAGPFVALHWLYVKHPFRGAGIGRSLEQIIVKDAVKVFYTHRVKSTDRLIGDKPYIFNPYLLGV